MLQKTRGIVLRSVKYGETSLVCTIFTDIYGVQSYMVQGIRSSSKTKQSRAGLLQPATLLDMVVYRKPQANLQRIREFQPAYIYQSLQEHVVKNSIALFSVELLLRLLPEDAPMPELYDTVYEYFCSLDTVDTRAAGNYPVYFLTACCNILGYTITGNHTDATPHLNLRDGGFTAHLPTERPFVSDEDARMLDKILHVQHIEDVTTVEMNGAARFRLLDWLLAFIHNHSQHMGDIKSLPVLRAVLHG
jgi:DNA repair protein RecO (recombination protein O)